MVLKLSQDWVLFSITYKDFGHDWSNFLWVQLEQLECNWTSIPSTHILYFGISLTSN